jgi:hypothetical protein
MGMVFVAFVEFWLHFQRKRSLHFGLAGTCRCCYTPYRAVDDVVRK